MNDVFASDPICDCDHTHSISDLTSYIASTPVSLEQRRHLMVGNVVTDLQILSTHTAKYMINHAFLFVRVWDLKPLCLRHQSDFIRRECSYRQVSTKGGKSSRDEKL